VAFLIYKEQNNGCWAQVQEVKLANAIKSCVQRIKRSGREELLRWETSDQELLAAEDSEFGKGKHRLVIDLKPASKGNLSLYQLEHIWGCTFEAWTPIALRLRPLFVDERIRDCDRFKQKFELPSGKKVAAVRVPVHEFLYLRHENGPENRWYWGRVGMVNGALLWPDVFDYFVTCIRSHGQESVAVL
jgi:hypothetical protein